MPTPASLPMPLPRLGLATRALGGPIEVLAAADDNESIAAIRHAVELGVRLLGTSPLYGTGRSETLIGRALQDCRDRFIIATKAGLVADDRQPEGFRRSLEPDSIRRQCENSLRRLRADVVDIYQLHAFDPQTPIADAMAAMVELLERGLIRAIGLCDFGCDQTAAAREHGPVHCVEAPFSLMNRRAAEDLIPYCQRHGIAFMASSPLARGLLTGRLKPDAVFRDLRARDPAFQGPRYAANLELAARLQRLAGEWDRSLPELALAWVMSYPGVTSALVGARRVSQVVINARAADWTLTDAQRARLEEVLAEAEGDTG